MALNQPPYNEDQVRSQWEYELTALVNQLEERSKTLLLAIENADDLSQFQVLLDAYNSILEKLGTANLYIQDEQPDPVYQQDFLWIQTNVNDDGDFSFWFCKED
jgi:hypothetical protein